MDINSNNPLTDQLPTQNEVYQSHNNNDQTFRLYPSYNI